MKLEVQHFCTFVCCFNIYQLNDWTQKCLYASPIAMGDLSGDRNYYILMSASSGLDQYLNFSTRPPPKKQNTLVHFCFLQS